MGFRSVNMGFTVTPAVLFLMACTSVFFLLGNLLLQVQTELPGQSWFFLAPLAIGMFSHLRIICSLCSLLAGFLWALFSAQSALDRVLVTADEQRDLEVVMKVVGIPIKSGRQLRFNARILSPPSLPETVRLRIYNQEKIYPAANLVPGDIVSGVIRLKKPNSLSNPGGFDYEAYLFAKGIGASGYVRSLRLLSSAEPWRDLAALRFKIFEKLERLVPEAQKGPILALTFGERSYMTAEQWEWLRLSGTAHLFAISGLHISLIFGLVYGLVLFFGLRAIPNPREIAVRPVALLLALLAAFFYSWLAEFSIPTQRALVMLACFVFCALFFRSSILRNALYLALVLVLVLDPLSPLSATFYLSFGALAAICAWLTGTRRANRVWRWVGLQLYLALALVPLTLYFFALLVPGAPIANAFAIPFMSFLVLPCALLAVFFSTFWPAAGKFFADFAGQFLEVFWRISDWLIEIPGFYWYLEPPVWALVLMASAFMVLPFIRTSYGFLFVALLCLVSFNRSGIPIIPTGSFQALFFDVGQGLSVFIRTRHHYVLFDTGPGRAPSFVPLVHSLLPYLRRAGINRLDTLVVSHGDNDHAGGLNKLREADIEVTARFSSDPALQKNGFEPCQRGNAWWVDEVRFAFLHPPPLSSRFSGNNASCVLQISTRENSLLLTGDIEHMAEQFMLKTQTKALKSSVLLVPHHGSLTSSSEAFIETVAPCAAVVSAGYKNRFRFPRNKVLDRYRKRDIPLFNTADTGALGIFFPAAGALEVELMHREDRRKYWNRKSRSKDLPRTLACRPVEKWVSTSLSRP